MKKGLHFCNPFLAYVMSNEVRHLFVSVTRLFGRCLTPFDMTIFLMCSSCYFSLTKKQ